MAVDKLVFIVEWSDPDPPYAGGIAGVFDNREDAKRLVEKFKFNHARITEWPVGFGGLPKAEQDAYKDYEDYMERGERQRLP